MLRQRRRRMRLSPPRLVHLVPNMLTILGLCAGMTAIRYALDQRFELAVTLLVRRRRPGWSRRPLGPDAQPDQQARRRARQPRGLPELRRRARGPDLSVDAARCARRSAGRIALLFATCCALRLARFNAELEPRTGRAGRHALLHRHPGTRRGRAGPDAADHVVRRRRRLAAQLAAQCRVCSCSWRR